MEAASLHPPSCVIVTGPTASGKSALGSAIAECFGGTIINADSMQVYRELRILTARPSEADEVKVPHRLYGVVSAAERFTVGRWLTLANEAIADTVSSGRLPVLVGGTGMYLHALTEGLSELPDIPPALRQASSELYRRLGEAAFRREVARVDPAAAARIGPADRQRLLRAWEVAAATGRSLTSWQATAPLRKPTLGRIAGIVVTPPREDIYAACDTRFDRMIAMGALDEVKALVALGLSADLPAMRAVGVPQLAAHLAGELTLADAVTAAKRASRNYAKRQLTWLRHHKISRGPFFTQFPERECQEILSFIRQFLLTGQD